MLQRAALSVDHYHGMHWMCQHHTGPIPCPFHTSLALLLLLLTLALLLQGNQLQKGDVLRVAQLAGVMGAKHTALLIPLCHNLFLSKVGRCTRGCRGGTLFVPRHNLFLTKVGHL
jgi:hypothetical protein